MVDCDYEFCTFLFIVRVDLPDAHVFKGFIRKLFRRKNLSIPQIIYSISYSTVLKYLSKVNLTLVEKISL